MIRTFIAVELPERFIPEIEKIGSELKKPGITLVNPRLVHFTLKFLGNISEDRIEPILSALSQIHCEPFQTRIQGIGVFPKPEYIRVIWLGAQNESDFQTLHTEVERVLLPFKFGKESTFTPHATIARVKQLREKEALLAAINRWKEVDLGTMDVESISLKKSTLTPKGPVYETLGEITLS